MFETGKFYLVLALSWLSHVAKIMKMSAIGKFYLVLIFVGLLLMSVGIILRAKGEREIDYTNIGLCNGEKSNATCPEYMEQHKQWRYCICFMDVVLPDALNPPIDLYYELETYDQTKIAESKDDEQLSGKLSAKPSSKCGNYSYSVTAEGITKPIAPCGALAAAMFNDTFSIYVNKAHVPMVSGVISAEDKAEFHNPPGSLTKAFENFTMPINWPEKKWNHFLNRDNAFEDEKFISWMKTNWKKKPFARINQIILVGTFTLRVEYNYPVSFYNGTRKLIITSPIYKLNGAGNSLIVTGCIIIVCGIVGVLYVILGRDRRKVPTHSLLS